VLHTAGQSENSTLDTVELQGLGRRPTGGLEGMYRRMTAVR
jgi:hypothetical protein